MTVSVEERLERAEAPDAGAARERARRVVLSAPVASRSRGRPRLAALLALAAVGVGLASSGEAIADWLTDLVEPTPPQTVAPPPEPRLGHLPSPGRLLVTGPGGAWSIGRDGTRVRLGDYDAVTWSPRGVFVAAATGDALEALTPEGELRWRVPVQDGPVATVAWSPSGYRVAYATRNAVRVVAGDGSGDHALLREASLALAWRPGSSNELAVARPGGAIDLFVADSGRRQWRLPSRLGDRAIALLWRSGRELVVVRPREVLLVDTRAGAARVRGRFTVDRPVTAAAIVGDRLALAAGAEVSFRRLRGAQRLGPPRVRLTAAGPVSDLVANPGATKLLVASAAADQWVFLPLKASKRTTAVTVRGFTSVAGWQTEPLASVGLADGRRIVLTATGREGSCLVISGIDEFDRRCGARWASPAELRADPAVQRSASDPVEVYGSVAEQVARVAIAYTAGGVAAVRDATVLSVDDPAVPFGYYFAELPPTATGITATAYDATGSALESDTYGATEPQAPIDAPAGRLAPYGGTTWAPIELPVVSPTVGDRLTSFEVALKTPLRTRSRELQFSANAIARRSSGPCRSDAYDFPAPTPAAGGVVVAHLQPAGEGAHLGWCPGDYRGKVVDSRKRVLERFAFRVKP